MGARKSPLYKKGKTMKEKTKTMLQIIALVSLLVLGFAYMIHQGNNEREYAEKHDCKWVAQGGLNICK